MGALRSVFVSLFVSLLVTTLAGPVAAAPDLAADVSQLAAGTVIVRNLGDTAAPAVHVALTCSKLPGSGCPESPGMAAYEVPQFPAVPQGHASIAVPALPPGGVFQHTLSFWDDLVWPAGPTYYLNVYVDPGFVVLDDANPGNNNDGIALRPPAVAGNGGLPSLTSEPVSPGAARRPALRAPVSSPSAKPAAAKRRPLRLRMQRR